METFSSAAYPDESGPSSVQNMPLHTASSTAYVQVDYPMFPSLLDSAYHSQDPVQECLTSKELEVQGASAYDLLDALSRSGSMVIEDAALHVVVASKHCFDQSLLDTVVRGNVNHPIEQLVCSILIAASTLYALPAERLVTEESLSRVMLYSPSLFLNATKDDLGFVNLVV